MSWARVIPRFVRVWAQAGRTPLHMAAQRGHKLVAGMLLDNEVFVDPLDEVLFV
jgi:hypothetical protein